MDEFKIIDGFKNYEINKNGIIRNIKTGRYMKIYTNKKGYCECGLKNNMGITRTKSIHRLVAMTFIPNLKNLPMVDHINGVRNDNNINNLRWVTNNENQSNRNDRIGLFRSQDNTWFVRINNIKIGSYNDIDSAIICLKSNINKNTPID